MSKLSKIEQAISVLEAAKAAGKIPDCLQERVSALGGVRSDVKGVLSAVAENAIPKVYAQQYDRLPDDIRKLCDWKTVSARLLANGGEKLKKAEAMQGGGELVGIDAEGKAMFKDKGVEPVLVGFDKGDRLVKIYDRDKKQMAKVTRWANYFEIREQVLKGGYELFALDCNNRLSDEMQQVQAHTKEPFVASRDRKEWRVSWTESGDRPDVARDVNFNPDGGRVGMGESNPKSRYSTPGVVRLLRV